MSDELADVEASENNAVQEVVSYLQDKDWFLADLIRVFAQSGVEFPLTLSVGGAMISGRLVSGKRYFEGVAEVMSSGRTNNEEVRKLLVRMLEQNVRIYERPEDAPEGWVPPEPGFIHLMDARVFTPGRQPLPENQGVLWRGKLNAIDGFWFGELRAG
jgi:hypothetical protein